MAANTDPIFARAPECQIATPILGPTAVTAMDGSGALVSVYQADITEGSFVDEIRLKAVGSPAATVCRVFACSVTGAFTSGTSNTTANTNLLTEITLAAVTQSNTQSQSDVSIPIRKGLPPGYRLLVAFGTSTGAAGVGYALTTFGGRY